MMVVMVVVAVVVAIVTVVVDFRGEAEAQPRNSKSTMGAKPNWAARYT